MFKDCHMKERGDDKGREMLQMLHVQCSVEDGFYLSVFVNHSTLLFFRCSSDSRTVIIIQPFSGFWRAGIIRDEALLCSVLSECKTCFFFSVS